MNCDNAGSSFVRIIKYGLIASPFKVSLLTTKIYSSEPPQPVRTAFLPFFNSGKTSSNVILILHYFVKSIRLLKIPKITAPITIEMTPPTATAKYVGQNVSWLTGSRSNGTVEVINVHRTTAIAWLPAVDLARRLKK